MIKMNKTLLYIFFIVFLFSCSKKVDNAPATPPTPTPVTPEQSIAFDIDAAAANTALGSSFSFNVRLTSTMPTAQGIRIEVSAIEEGTGTAVSPQNVPIISTSTTVAASVISLPVQKWVITTVKVSSVATATNTASKTFRVVSK